MRSNIAKTFGLPVVVASLTNFFDTLLSETKKEKENNKYPYQEFKENNNNKLIK